MAVRWITIMAALIQIQSARTSCFSRCRCFTQELDCSHANSTNIPSNGAVRVTSYTSLNMSYNHIQVLEEHAFTKRGFSMVETLDISNNFISEINSYAFRGLNRINKLYLANNRLEDLSDMVFEPLVNLHEIYLQGNKLSRISSEILSPLKKLIILDIRYNRITDIDKAAFYDLSDLKVLRLDGNVMREFIPEMFNPLKNVQYLELQFFKILHQRNTFSPTKTEQTSCLCKRKTALDWCRERAINCYVTCDVPQESTYDGDSQVCSNTLNDFSKTEITKKRTVTTMDFVWAIIITIGVIVLLVITVTMLVLVVRKAKAHVDDDDCSVISDFEEYRPNVTSIEIKDNNLNFNN